MTANGMVGKAFDRVMLFFIVAAFAFMALVSSLGGPLLWMMLGFSGFMAWRFWRIQGDVARRRV